VVEVGCQAPSSHHSPVTVFSQEHGFFIKVVALCPGSSSGPTNIFANINIVLSPLHAACSQLPLLKQYGHYAEGRKYLLMSPLFMTPLISLPAAASFISSKHGSPYYIGSTKHSFSISQDAETLSLFEPSDAVEFHLLRRSLVYRVQVLLLAAAGQTFSVTAGEQSRKMPHNHVPDPHCNRATAFETPVN
jgi:hypothetical protein